MAAPSPTDHDRPAPGSYLDAVARVKGLRIGLISTPLTHSPVDPEVSRPPPMPLWLCESGARCAGDQLAGRPREFFASTRIIMGSGYGYAGERSRTAKAGKSPRMTWSRLSGNATRVRGGIPREQLEAPSWESKQLRDRWPCYSRTTTSCYRRRWPHRRSNWAN